MQNTSNVNGIVTDPEGEPLIGASVTVKGQAIGVATDIDGNFSIANVKPGATIMVSYIGYTPFEGKATYGEPMKITLHEDSEMLSEVVVVGYGTQKKETLSGSIAVVDSKIFKDKGTTSNPLKALQGAIPGTVVTRTSGAPGEEGWNISVRGAVSLNTTSPLVIIDGMPQEGTGALSALNPNDIESMSFLKDASAAIYGAKAASGVILVTTKSAKSGKAKIEYSGSYTRKFVGLQPSLMSYDQWIECTQQTVLNDGLGTDNAWYQFPELAKTMKGSYIYCLDGRNPSQVLPSFPGMTDFTFMDVDWNKVLWKDANSTQHDLSISGGSDAITYRISLGYLYDQSNLRWGNNSNERFNIRASNDIRLSDKLKLNSVIAATRRHQVAPTRIADMLTSTPVHVGFPVSTIDGKPYNWGSEYGPNWLGELGGDNKLVTTDFSINETLKWNILPGLDLTASGSYSTNNATRDKKYLSIDWYDYLGNPRAADKTPWPKLSDNYYENTSNRTDRFSVQAYVNFNRTFKDIHSVNIMAGLQYDYLSFRQSGTRAYNIRPSLDIINGSGEIELSKGDMRPRNYEEAMLSYFMRVNYNLMNRYLIEGNFRYDGSSKFRAKNRWDAFYGISAAWRIAEEPFMAALKPTLNELKLKLSYGQVGNQSGIDRYDGIQFYNFRSSTGALLDGDYLSYLEAGNMVSLERSWERIHNYNIGLDLGMLNNRLTGSVDVFMKRNNNMLVAKKYSGVLGAEAPALNNGKFESHGWEGQISWRDKIGNVSYSVGGSFTYMTNKLKEGGEDVAWAGYNAKLNGYPIGSIFGYRYVGKIQNEEQLRKYTNRYLSTNTIGMPAGLRLGDNMYEDVNGDGKLTQDDLVYLGTDMPKIQYSFNFTVNWKGFDFSATFQGAAKRTVCRPADSYKVPFKTIYRNTSNVSYGKVWSPEHPDNPFPTYSNQEVINNYNYLVSSWYVEDGAYIRLKNVSLGYTFPQSVYKHLANVVSNIRIYVSGSDLWEHSNITDGWDPEASRNVSAMSRYPFNRTFTAGLNLTF